LVQMIWSIFKRGQVLGIIEATICRNRKKGKICGRHRHFLEDSTFLVTKFEFSS
jgi:hypothetical protein